MGDRGILSDQKIGWLSLETLQEFKSRQSTEDLHPLLQALWHDHRGDWKASHEIAQNVNTSDGSWVHAYLHRKEGDISNASYWYSMAGKKLPSVSLEKEWDAITETLIRKYS